MAGQIFTGVSIGPGVIPNCDGNVYITCVIVAGTTLEGDAITFVDCSLNGTSGLPIAVPGTGTVLTGGASTYTVFGPATVVQADHANVAGVIFGPDSNVKGAMFTFTKPVVDTNMPCKQETEGDAPAEVREVCWNMRRENEDQSTTGSRA